MPHFAAYTLHCIIYIFLERDRSFYYQILIILVMSIISMSGEISFIQIDKGRGREGEDSCPSCK